MIHLAIAFDQNYLQQFYSLLTSVLENTKKTKLHFHLISPDVSEIEKEQIRNYIKSRNAESIFYTLNEGTLGDLVLAGKWTHAVYYRLFFPMLVSSEVSRLLYLDSDTVVVNDLSELYEIDLENYPLGAVYDNYVKEQPLIEISKGNYFNSGVLLINIKKWKEQDISRKVLLYLRAYPKRIIYVDQCGLNAVLKENWKQIDYKYNVLYTYIPTEASKAGLKHFISDKVVIHFTLQRPWDFLCKNRLRFLYWHYLQISPLAKRSTPYSGFSLAKIPAWLKIRIAEMYFDNLLLQRVWKKLTLK